ncbi:MAG: hypothetical protein GY699_09810 [Desulfobacteraceae bacterium]|nr:hypothetical protein [Desulfobacteraceae bacterium]
MAGTNIKPTVLWVLQANQISPLIVNFLTLIKKNLTDIHIQVMIPGMHPELAKITKKLNPKIFTATKEQMHSSYEAFCNKRNLVQDLEFSNGLKVWRTLVLDDFAEGTVSETKLKFPNIENVKAIILQMPSHLGSSREEEYIFYAWISLAQKVSLPISGYEMLPLDTRWTMLASLLDGIITTNNRSFEYLSLEHHGLKASIWKLPQYQGKVFSTGGSQLWENGLNVPYHYQKTLHIPKDKTILYIPHCIATSYEYKILLERLSAFGNHIHLMFSIGKDEVRGTHHHKDIVQTICATSLGSFYSYSFHDIESPVEMVMADAVIACCSCYITLIAKEMGMPCVIVDTYVSPNPSENPITVNTKKELKDHIEKIIARHNTTTELSHILQEMVSGKIKKIAP